MNLHLVYTSSNVEECFFCAAFASQQEAKRWIRNLKRRGYQPELFIVVQTIEELIQPEVK